MKTIKTNFTCRRAVKLCGGFMAMFLVANITEAHLTYTGRDFGAFSGQTNGTKSITNQTVTGNYGWADAADGILGDSHRGRAFRVLIEKHL